MDACIYSCQHPVWGGAGVCVDGNVGEGRFCLCEDGFVSRDSYGEPSCVRTWIQLLVYTTAATVQFAGALFLAWDATRHRMLPAPLRTSRRAKLRLRLGRSTSVAITWLAIVSGVGAVRTWTGYLLHTRVIPVLLLVASTVGTPACMFVVELWVDSLPKVLAADSLEARIKQLAEKHHVFFWAGSLGALSLALIHGTVLALFDTRTAMSVNDKIVGAVSLSMGICILFIGVRISRVINHAEAQARLESKAFYSNARKKLWRQVAALSGACSIFSMIIGANDVLAPVRWTPVFVVASYNTVATFAFVMAIRFSRPNLSSVRALPVPEAAAYVHSAPRPGSPPQKEGHKKDCLSDPC